MFNEPAYRRELAEPLPGAPRIVVETLRRSRRWLRIEPAAWLMKLCRFVSANLPDAARRDCSCLLSPIPAHLCMGRFAKRGTRMERPCRCREYRQGLSLRARLRDMGETAYGLRIVPAQMLELAIESAIIAPSFLRVVRK